MSDKELYYAGIRRNENGFPLCEDGTIDWELTAKEKTIMAEKWKKKAAGGKIRKRITNYTPPKKKRRK